MKRILLMAMVVFAFMACNENGASVPSGDKKAIKTVTSAAVDLIGATPDKVDKTLQDAGFTKADGTLSMVAKRAIQARGPKKASVRPVEVRYVYNVPSDYQKMDEDEVRSYVKKVLGKGECLVLVTALYADEALVAIATEVMAPIKEKINLIYTENSDGLFQKLPKLDGMYTTWRGVLYNEQKEYSDHAAFVADVAAAQAVRAEEFGYHVTVTNMETGEGEGFGYTTEWHYPTAKEATAMREENGFAGVTGAFSVMDYSAMNQPK